MPERIIPRYVVILSILFVASSLLGFYAPIPCKLDLLGTLMESFKPFLALSPWKMLFVILLNNSAKSFAVLLSGILFGLVPFLAVATNGYILRIALLYASGKVGDLNTVRLGMPHGVLEIPAGILSAAYGLWLGVTFGKFIRQEDIVGSGY